MNTATEPCPHKLGVDAGEHDPSECIYPLGHNGPHTARIRGWDELSGERVDASITWSSGGRES